MAEQMDEIGIFVSLPSKGSLPLFTELNLNNGFYSPTKVLSGKFIMLILKKATSITINPEKLAGKYHDGTVYTKKEIDMIPKLKDSYIVPQEVISICEHISKTAGSSHPIRNIMLRGESSVGKTSSAKAVASALGRPMVAPVTCHADFETADFLMQCVPVETQVDETFDLPTFEDILMDPSTAYHMLTGEYIENITETEVYEKLTERIYQKAQLQNSNTKSPVRYQESSLITAMRYGYVCEVQEASVILKQGVLVGLNSLLDDCEEIMLPTGERLHRHPNTIIILTTNNDYEGCQNFNQSVISRMDLIYDIDDLKMDDYIERGMANTGFQDRNMVTQMAETLLEVKNHLKERYITDGSCGLREFIAWIQSYMITGKIIDSAIITILSSLSKEMENRNEIYDTCIKTKFLE